MSAEKVLSSINARISILNGAVQVHVYREGDTGDVIYYDGPQLFSKRVEVQQRNPDSWVGNASLPANRASLRLVKQLLDTLVDRLAKDIFAERSEDEE